MGLAASQQMFENMNLSDPGQKSNNDLDLSYLYVFMHSLSQLFVPTFNSYSYSIVSIQSSNII